jgi:hypothetical protein
MGDEELNFTEEEARCWADDPRNQPRDNQKTLGIVAICALLLVAFIAFVLATGSGRSKSDGGVAHGGETHADTVLGR